MELNFQAGRLHIANTLERGDKYDHSVVHWLSTLPGEAFLVERKHESWIVTPGTVSVSQGDPVLYLVDIVEEEFTPTFPDEKPKAAKSKAAKPEDTKPKKKKR